MTSTPTRNSSDGSSAVSQWKRHGSSNYVPAGTHRLEGPALPAGFSPTASRCLESLNERLEHLAFGRRPEGFDPPPLETYTTSATEHGDLVRATQEYVRWFHRTYPAAGSEDRARVPTPRPNPEGYGGETNLSDL